MNQTFDQQLQFLMTTQQDEYTMVVKTINRENEIITYTINFIHVEDFTLSAIHDNYEDDYSQAQTDYEHLILDFSSDRILEITIYDHLDNVVEYFNDQPYEISVDYTRKMPKKIDECPICLDSLILDICANKKCKHLYHCECILKWNVGSCPVCRRELDLYKIQDVDDYRQTAGFTLFGKISDIKYLRKLINCL